MTRRGQMSAAAAIVAIAGLLLPITSVGAAVFTPSDDLPDDTPAAPAAPTPADTTSVVEYLASSDVDSFAVCVTDPAALHVVVEGVDDAGAPRAMDTVMWLLDADGMLVATNDDRSATDLGSELVAGAAAATSPGVHVVAFAPFRSMPLDAAGADMGAPGSGPLTSWRHGSSAERWSRAGRSARRGIGIRGMWDRNRLQRRHGGRSDDRQRPLPGTGRAGRWTTARPRVWIAPPSADRAPAADPKVIPISRSW